MDRNHLPDQPRACCFVDLHSLREDDAPMTPAWALILGIVVGAGVMTIVYPLFGG